MRVATSNPSKPDRSHKRPMRLWSVVVRASKRPTTRGEVAASAVFAAGGESVIVMLANVLRAPPAHSTAHVFC